MQNMKQNFGGPNAILILPLTLITVFCFGYIFAQSNAANSATASQQPSQTKDATPKPLPMAKQQDLPKLDAEPVEGSSGTAATASPNAPAASGTPQASGQNTSGLQAAVPNQSPVVAGNTSDTGKKASSSLQLLDLSHTLRKILP